ncbi:hypothetical protein LTR10_015251 [Elasticomyces elasticus]|uniref:Uncharacterized protein n=1 Tax=Exophiala sideris TaxID=1016849 RepID=A0ABR0JEI3_9EURO|nr:hypothetical protein LTR10_015251 [Elasticomyces elasticus]KAK5032726.1 hypothetical protein LTS07_004136 [Exophiala sideris]KAK5037094.1 hypothetical protein LTR13_004899 [Exophiala sideris]KAK5062250.1 hypothetical protein LTR69_004608 [Exophiala sideris]
MRKFVNCSGKSAGWNPEFRKSRRGRYYDAHKMFKDWHEEAKGIDDEDEECQSDPGEEDGEDGEVPSTIQTFMQGPQGSDTCELEATFVENFCDDALLECLHKGTRIDLPDNRKNIWFAGSCTSGAGSSKLQPQWLTSQNFYAEFKKHCMKAQDIPGVSSGPTHETSPDDGDMGAREATSSSSPAKHTVPHQAAAALLPKHQNQQGNGHHLIFVNDPDSLNFCALIGTASCHLTSPLGKTLYNHLASVASIDIETLSDRFLTFRLSFSLPYCAWRSSQEPCSDQRRTRTNEPLRHFRDVSLLNLEPDKAPAFLYEAQISCVVAGFDEWTWTALCLQDSYFEGKAGENAQQYSKDDKAGANTNPFLRPGLTEAGLPFHKARQFFLRIFSVRLKQVRKEWRNIVTNIKNSVSKYEKNHHHLLLQAPRPGNTRHDEADIRSSLDWVNAVMSITTLLSELLSKTVDACAKFTKTDAVNFRDFRNISYGEQMLQTIQNTIQSLAGLEADLKAITRRCKEFDRKLEFRIQLEAIRMGNCQKSLSTIMMLYVSPIAMSAQIFSTQENLMPAIPRNFGTFAVLALIFGIATHFIVRYQDQPVHDWKKRSAPTTQLLYGDVTRFWAVCRDMLRLLLRHTAKYGARANTLFAELFQFLRRHRPIAPPPEGEELEMVLPLRGDPVAWQDMAFPPPIPSGTTRCAIDLSHAV